MDKLLTMRNWRRKRNRRIAAAAAALAGKMGQIRRIYFEVNWVFS